VNMAPLSSSPPKSPMQRLLRARRVSTTMLKSVLREQGDHNTVDNLSFLTKTRRGGADTFDRHKNWCPS